MITLSRSLLFALLAVAAAPSWAGISFGGGTGPTKLTSVRGLVTQGMNVRVVGVSWIGPNGKPTHRRLTRPTPLDRLELVAPPGEWTDLTLALDGPMVITGTTADGDDWTLTLDVDTWTVPLDEPVLTAGGERLAVEIDLAMPAWLAEEAVGGLDVRPGDARYDAAVLAVQDGALGRVR